MTETRQRADRISQERLARFERSEATIDGSQRLKLAVPPEVADRLRQAGEEPRWINDEGNRMHNLTVLDAYDRVDGVEPVVVGTSKNGHPIKAYLCSKPKAFIEKRQQRLEAGRRATEAALVRGKNPEDPITGNNSFYADEANTIRRGGSG